MKRVLAIIPSRYASSRFPGKPLALVKGVPMVVRVYRRAKEIFEDVCVATDDKRIFDTVVQSGGEAVMTSSEHKSGTDRCLEALQKYSADKQKNFDVVINVQGDEPFIATSQLKELEQCFEEDNVEIATLVKRAKSVEDVLDYNRPKVVLDNNGNALYFSRSVIPHDRDSFKKNNSLTQSDIENNAYYLHIGLYGYTAESLTKICSLPLGNLEKIESLEQLRWLENGLKIKVAVTESENSYGIDTPEDLERVNAMI